MDIVRFKGGLGNQMFQYAFYSALKARKRVVKASIGYYMKHPEKRGFSLIKVFPQIMLDYILEEEFEKIDYQWKEVKQNNRLLEEFKNDYHNRFFWVEDDGFTYYPQVFETQNCAFVGFWQSEKYFYDIRDTLLKDFEFSYGEEKLHVLGKKIRNNPRYVSVHIRRGDYLRAIETHGNLSESSYYQKAIDYINYKVCSVQPVFFSDDICWVKKNYRYENAIYVESNMFDKYEAWYDMWLMTCCAHNIIANSTFSWWGAWLNKNASKIVIAPEQWFFDGKNGKDICPSSWLRL